MPQFIVRRVLYSIVTLCILSATIFLIVRLTGDPVSLMAEASARPEDLERIRHQWGLDRSWPVPPVTLPHHAFHPALPHPPPYPPPPRQLHLTRPSHHPPPPPTAPLLPPLLT